MQGMYLNVMCACVWYDRHCKGIPDINQNLTTLTWYGVYFICLHGVTSCYHTIRHGLCTGVSVNSYSTQRKLSLIPIELLTEWICGKKLLCSNRHLVFFTGNAVYRGRGSRNGFIFTPVRFITSETFLNRLMKCNAPAEADGIVCPLQASVPADSGNQTTASEIYCTS